MRYRIFAVLRVAIAGNWFAGLQPLTRAQTAETPARVSGDQIEVVDLGINPSPDEMLNANKAYKQGHVIRVIGGSPANFARLTEISLVRSKAFFKRSSSFIEPDLVRANGVPLVLRGVAGYMDSKGATHSVQTFAAANDRGDGENGWKRHLNDLVTTEKTKALSSVGDHAPPSQAWTRRIPALS